MPMQIARRNLLLAAAASAAGLSSPAQAAGAPERPLPWGCRRMRVAGADLTAISDCTGPQNISIARAPAERIASLLSDNCLAPETLEAFHTVFLVEVSGRRILVDAGFGAPRGKTLARLSALGVKPDTVTDILLTHCHGDHIGGLLRDGEALFSRAALWVRAADEEHFTVRAAEGARRLAAKVFSAYAGRVRHFADGERLLPGIQGLWRSGHTPGHAFFALGEGRDQVVFAGDVAHMAAVQFADPSISMVYDVDPQAAARVRAETFGQAADGRWLLAGAHLPYPGVGHVRRRGSEYEFLPATFLDR